MSDEQVIDLRQILRTGWRLRWAVCAILVASIGVAFAVADGPYRNAKQREADARYVAAWQHRKDRIARMDADFAYASRSAAMAHALWLDAEGTPDEARAERQWERYANVYDQLWIDARVTPMPAIPDREQVGPPKVSMVAAIGAASGGFLAAILSLAVSVRSPA